MIPAWRTFIRNLKRYRVLLMALILISLAFTVVLGTVLGLRDAVRRKSSRYFAGDLVVLGFAGNGGSLLDGTGGEGSADAVAAAIAALPVADVEIRAWSRRSSYYDFNNVELFFAGYYTHQRRLVGVEWNLERPVLEEFEFSEGGVPEDDDREGALISSSAAKDLGIRVGDNLLVSIKSDRGRINTVELIVRGIYSESSFFGYTVYMDRLALNVLREAPEERVNEMGVYLVDPGGAEERAAKILTDALADRGLPTFDVLSDRASYEAASREKRNRREFGVVTLAGQLVEITDLISAITIIAGVVMVLFLGIVTVGVGNTWTMVVYERTREIGTLRALGMQKTGVTALFLLEALFLGLTGVILGGVAGVGTLWILEHWVSFAPNAATTLFFTRGRLPWRIPPWTMILITGLSVGASILGSLRATIRAARIHPVEALRR